MKPLDALNNKIGSQVLVRMKNGWEVNGTLKAFDIHINLVLDDAEFKDNEINRKVPQMFLRGDMIVFVG